MTFGRWILVHSFSIFLVTLFVLGYFYREELQLAKAYEQLLSLDAERIVQEVSSKTDQSEITTAQTDATTEQQNSTSSEIANSEQPVVKVTGFENQPDDPSAEGETVPAQVTSKPEKPGNQVIDTPQIEPQALQQEQLLQQARQAYWDKQYELSINFYQQLMAKNQDNPDFPGELGNIYYALNDYPNASQQYYRAAQILIAQQQYQRAKRLIAPITAMNRELGDRLAETLK